MIYEAAHAIVNMKETTPKDLAPAVSVLQLFLSSPKPTLRFAAVRTLNKVWGEAGWCGGGGGDGGSGYGGSRNGDGGRVKVWG